jgi:hypothetical protein
VLDGWIMLRLHNSTIGSFLLPESLMSNIIRFLTAAIIFAAQTILLTSSADAAVALGRAGCEPNFSRCQQTCKDNSVGGKNYGVGLWDSSRSKSCYQSCSSARNQCRIQSKKDSVTQKK